MTVSLAGLGCTRVREEYEKQLKVIVDQLPLGLLHRLIKDAHTPGLVPLQKRIAQKMARQKTFQTF